MRPGEGKQLFRLHFLHDRLPFEMLVTGICDLATRDLTLDKWAIQFHTKPFAKFTVSVSARQTREIGALSSILFSIRSFIIRNLQVAYYNQPTRKAIYWLRV